MPLHVITHFLLTSCLPGASDVVPSLATTSLTLRQQQLYNNCLITAPPCNTSSQHLFAAPPCSTSLQHLLAAPHCSTSLQHLLAAPSGSTSLQHLFVAPLCSTSFVNAIVLSCLISDSQIQLCNVVKL